MKTNNRQGRSIALIVGVYFIAKSVLNLILGGSVLDVIIAPRKPPCFIQVLCM